MSTKSAPTIAIVAPHDQWILDKLATQLVEGIDACVRLAQAPDASYDLVYSVPYYHWTPLLTKTAAFFTHLPGEPARKRRFLQVAESCDYGVSMAQKYLDLIIKIRQKCNKSSDGYVLITPGPEACFSPKLRLANVGKLYARKGVEFLDAVAALPFVELVRTSGTMTSEEVVNLYRSVDYTLITATVEGGPMSLLESLACGTPVIGPSDVGLIPQFKDARDGGNVHKYQIANWQSLKELLSRLYEKKLEMAVEVSHIAPDWVGEHRRFFEMILDQPVS